MKTFETVRRWRKAVKWMRRNYRVILTVLIFIFVAILAFGFDLEAGAVMAMALPGVVVDGADGGEHVVGGPLVTDLTRQASPSLLLNEIDQQIVKIRPMSTPIDQISRYAKAQPSKSFEVKYYSVGTRPVKTTLAQSISASTGVSTAIIAVASLLLEILLGVSPIIIVASVIAFGLIMYFAVVRKKDDAGKEVEK